MAEVGIQTPTLSLALAAGYGTLVPYAVVNDTEITGQSVPFYCEYWVEYQDTFDQHSIGAAPVKNGNPFTLPNPPVHAGQKFLGWFTEDGQKITEESTANLTRDITLFGKYAKDDRYAISDLTWDGGQDIPQGTFSAQIQVSGSAAGSSDRLIAAVYDAHGKLLSVNCATVPAPAGGSSTVSVQLTNPGTADYLQAFVVSADDGSSPLCNSFSTKSPVQG